MTDEREEGTGRLARAVLAALCAALGAGLAAAVLSLPPRDPGLALEAAASLEASGVGNPVTAVLLSLRGYDTLLEVAVLLAALAGVWSLVPDEAGRARPQPAPAEPALAGFARLAGPVGVLVAAYLFWTGAEAPGGAFQAATVLAATVLLLRFAGLVGAPPAAGCGPGGTAVRLLSVAGFATFLGVGLAGIATTGTFLGYPPDAAKALILAIEATLTVSLAAILLLLVLGLPEDAP
ncbi:Na(+)/H(+) antiporter subunit B [Arenibaculum sp.]|jgi:multisubunit Na+/H+ antiporter MnhB subunit|uniref:Na(+)/H(+) antiporter subunit B n=1 Tax=Arenibaculum sp. TaxID=2865862 RepID=UPI002E0EE4E5|nr:Na(+)/H(+) antiporter subunit B [Arenibaculum sp.]